MLGLASLLVVIPIAGHFLGRARDGRGHPSVFETEVAALPLEPGQAAVLPSIRRRAGWLELDLCSETHPHPSVLFALRIEAAGQVLVGPPPSASPPVNRRPLRTAQAYAA